MIEFIVNPVSRGKQGALIWNQVEAELRRQNQREGIDYRLHLTKPDLDAGQSAEALTREQTEERQVLAVLGGDGTLNEVLNGLHLEQKSLLGYIPTGSGNDFARAMHCTRDIGKAVDLLLHPKYFRKLDYGEVTCGDGVQRRFLVSGGIGFDAAVCHKLLYSGVRKSLQKVHLEKLSYLVTGIWQLFGSGPMNGELVTEDGMRIKLKRSRFVSAHIQPYEGGGFCFAPEADPSDGKLSLCVMNHMGVLGFFLAMFCSLFRKHGFYPGVTLHDCKEVRITIQEKKPVHTDGESAGCQREVRFTCHKGCLVLITEKN